MLRYTLRNQESAAFPLPEGMPPALHRLLAGRGIASAEAAEAYLHPGPDSLHDPMLLSDMDRAVERIRAAMAAGEVICVYGDYDVDGVCASAILSQWLRENGADARVYLPSRHSEGYGLNEAAVREIAGWAGLMVTVDCGVTSAALVALAKALGLDVIVTDHHQPPREDDGTGAALPECPVVNPLLGGYPFPSLCGAGVAWKLVWALSGLEAAMAYVDIAALATVADVVPLTEENRAITAMGLERINRAPRPGIAALADAAGLSGKRVTSTAVAFQLAPRLNAGGRLGSAMRSLALLVEEDAQAAAARASELEAENARRRDIETKILREAEAQLADFDFPAHRALILHGADWNPGVIGLAASRLVERYHYPVVLLTGEGEELTGSCRSIEGMDIYAALSGCAHTLRRFGGHRQAAGLALSKARLEPFRSAMDEWLRLNVDPWAYLPECRYDAELDFGEVTPGFIASLERVQPTGFGNPAPLFRAKAEVVDARAVGADGAHLKLTLAQGGHRLGGIAFREGRRAGDLAGGVDALFVPSLNSWMGRAEPQLEVRALTDADAMARLAVKVADESRLQCEFLTGMLYNKRIVDHPEPLPEVDLATLTRWLFEKPQGTLVVTADIDFARMLLERTAERMPDLYIGQLPGDPRGYNALCVCPPTVARLRGYGRIALAGVPVEWLGEGDRARACRVACEAGWTQRLPDLDVMRTAYLALARLARRPVWCASVGDLARMAAEEAGVDDVAAAASLLAMIDMGLFRLDAASRPISLARGERAKAVPEESSVYNAIRRWRQGV